MAAISSLGVGSNLDLSGLLDKLAASESQPLVALQKQQVSYTSKLSAYGTLQNALSNFQAAATKLADATLYQGVKAVSSASDVLTGSASATGAPGDYSIEITKLARAQSLVTAGQVSASTVIGVGTLTVDFGTITGGTYDAVAGKYTGAGFNPPVVSPSAVSLTIDSSNNTLEGIRDAINKKTGLGVTASIVNDGGASPFRLVLTSAQTGVASSMRIGVTGDASLQNLLGYDATALATQNLQQIAVADNAALKVNGIAVTSSSNTVKEAVQGVTLTLAKTGLSTLTLSRDSASVETAVGAFASAYNALQSTASQLTKYDVAKKTGAALVGDSTLRNIQTSIRSALNTPQAGALKVLSSVGVSFQKDGTLAVDSTKLKTALADQRNDVAELFAGTSGASSGYGTQLAALIGTFTGSDGKLSNATAGVKTTLKSLDAQYAATQVSVQAKIASYRAQFTQLDMLMAKMNSTTSYLTQQFSSMNASKN